MPKKSFAGRIEVFSFAVGVTAPLSSRRVLAKT
jgi:hypothetical protein